MRATALPVRAAALAAVIRALRVDGDSTYVWLGQRHDVPPGMDLVEALADRLYEDFHCTGTPAPPIGPPPDRMWSARHGPVSVPGWSERMTSDPGWEVISASSEEVVVSRDGLRIWARPAEIASPDAVTGAIVALRVPATVPGPPDGFASFLSSADTRGPTGSGPDRWYWNVAAEGRPHLVEVLSTALDTAGLPFRVKVLNDPRGRRCDAGVLYTDPLDRRGVAACAERALPGIARHLHPRTPPLSLGLAPGVGFAEQPPGDHSFGTHRCRLLAEALAGEGARHPIGDEARLAYLIAHVTAGGLEPSRLHANPGSDPADDPAPFTT